MGDASDLEPMVRASCTGCGKPWVSTLRAFADFPRCPFCGNRDPDTEQIRIIEMGEEDSE